MFNKTINGGSMQYKSTAVLALAAFLLGITPARAASIPTISFTTVTAAPGSTGNMVDLLLTNTSLASITVASFNFDVTSLDPDITFTGADMSPASAPYIFLGDSFDAIFGFPFVTSVSPLHAFDLSFSGAGTTLAQNAVVGLGRLFFSVAPNAAQGGFAIHLTPDPGTSLADASGGPIPASLVDGEITIASAPEPATLGLLFSGVALIFVRRRFRC
jgi:hypothetical protein